MPLDGNPFSYSLTCSPLHTLNSGFMAGVFQSEYLKFCLVSYYFVCHSLDQRPVPCISSQNLSKFQCFINLPQDNSSS